MMKYLIYEIKNKINGKFYIGQYSRDENDFNSYYGSGKLIKFAIKKYGLKNFDKIIIEECINKEELNQKEIFWIKEKKAIEKGYNLIEGGTGGDTSKFINYKSESYKIKKSISIKEYWDRITDNDR